MARFTGRAAWYARARPSYPDAAVSFVLGDASRVIDAGAGTGISTRLLGARAVGVDPSLDMILTAGDARFVLARAETLPFRNAAADLVTSFNAFHWFQPDAFFAEAHRVLARGGRLALVWNDWDRGDPFTNEFVTLMRSRAPADFPPEDRDAEVTPLYQTKLFTNIERRDFPYVHRLDREHLRMRLQSMSYIPAGGPDWDALSRELDALYEKYAENGVVNHRYTTAVFISYK